MKLCKQQALCCEGVDIRRRDVTAIAAEICITQIIRDDQQNVGGSMAVAQAATAKTATRPRQMNFGFHILCFH